MSATPNFGFEVPVGSDTVNLLTQNYPNWTSLDTILQAIKDAGVTSATETKVGTVHQLVRTVSSCNVLRFTATSNFASGDTFTVDGNAVTTTTPQGTSLEAGAFVINQSVIGILNGAVLTLAVGGGASNAAGISYDNTGSGLTASNVQDAIDEVVGDIPTSLAASAITYDNTGSGLTATDVQDAIDEIASGGGGGAEHGIYELWTSNHTPGTDWAGQQVTFTSDKTIDALIIVIAGADAGSGNESAAVWNEIEVSKISNAPFVMYDRLLVSGQFYDYRRAISSITISGTSYSLTFGDCYRGTGSETRNMFMVPIRILGLVHNT